MINLISDNILTIVFIGGPAILLAMLALVLTWRGLRAGPLKAVFSFLMAIILVLLIGGAATVWSYQDAAANAIPACEAKERAAREVGEVGIFDCNDEVLIIIIPIAITAVAIGFVLFGVIASRFVRRDAPQ